MKIRINGTLQEVPEGTRLSDLLVPYRQQHAIVVGEVNGRIPDEETLLLENDDRVEIVTFVGGG